MINIDVDKNRMLENTLNFYSQLNHALEVSEQFDLNLATVNNIVVFGMGGSAIGGKLLYSLLFDELDLPFNVIRGYEIPENINSGSLAVLSSYSGNTEEVLNCYEQVKHRTNNSVIISSNGKLEEIALANNIPFLKIPGGFQPRAALGYSLVALLRILFKAGVIEDKADEIKSVSRFLKGLSIKYDVKKSSEENFPLNLAEKLINKIPVIYSPSERFLAIAERWKAQFNENSEIPAFINAYPELNHNEIMSYNSKDLTNSFFVINFTNLGENKRTEKRIKFTGEIVNKYISGHVNIEAIGENILHKVLSLIYLDKYGFDKKNSAERVSKVTVL